MAETTLHARRCGVLCAVTALPETPGNGDFDGACRFIDWLAAAGVTLWQLLPMGIPHADRSPYLALSAHAGDPNLIGLSWLRHNGLLAPHVEVTQPPAGISAAQFRRSLIHLAQRVFIQHANSEWRQHYHHFLQSASDWLDDYALFAAIHNECGNTSWVHWHQPLRDREPNALNQARRRLENEIEQIKFAQFLFFKQWSQVRTYAHQHGVLLFGDLPLFVAHDSADVWAHRRYFQLDDNGDCQVVAGVPPDYFSATGQRWGNPHYRWAALAGDNFSWWVERLQTALILYDWVRIDHFRGLQAVWEIPASAETAQQGVWRETPGAALLETLQHSLSTLPLVAEDLGLITPPVVELRDRFGLPGMAILQFAFDGGADNPYLPHNLDKHTVLYSGTHDNDTTLGWFEGLPPPQQQRIADYLRCDRGRVPQELLATALGSVARWAVLPLQDVLGLGAGHRTNTPGTTEGNWQWRFGWSQLKPEIGDRLLAANQLYGR